MTHSASIILYDRKSCQHLDYNILKKKTEHAWMPLIDALKSAFVLLAITLILAGCASTGVWLEADTKDYIERMQTQTDGAVQVSTSVLSAIESLVIYGIPLAIKGIQPVWIEVENNDDIAYWLMPSGLDPNYFPASEAADAFAPAAGSRKNRKLNQHFRQLAFRNPVTPGTTVSGFILTNLDEGVKMVEIDLVASGHLRTFSYLADVPGFRADYAGKQNLEHTVHEAHGLINYTNDAAFRAALEALPCCTTNKKGTRNGDPLNLVIVGGSEDAFPALVRRGWHPTEATYAGSVRKMINSVLSGARYPYSPISPLYLYDRPQDFALQKARDNIHQRNHLRLWLSPMQFHGKPVWVGQISRDIGTRLTIHSPYLTTHKIDPNVDEALVSLIEDLAYSQNLQKMGLVKGVGAAPRNKPRENLTTDPYFTNGLRGVLIFDEHPTSLADIEFLPWEGMEDGMVDAAIKSNRQ
ncbi:MAG: LssY C-terminal domain-containing protein [Pseudomonadota bacterium]